MGEDFHKHPDNKKAISHRIYFHRPNKLHGSQHPLYSVKNQQDFIEGTWAH